MQDIISMSREKTAKWIPNAIQINTNSEKVKFREQMFYIPIFYYIWRDIRCIILFYIYIYICCDFPQLFFSSFSAREKSYLGMFRLWQNVLMEKVISFFLTFFFLNTIDVQICFHLTDYLIILYIFYLFGCTTLYIYILHPEIWSEIVM